MRTSRRLESTPSSTVLPRLLAVDESHLLSMQLALTAHGIAHTVHHEPPESVSRWPSYIAVEPADFDRATALVRELQFTPPPTASWSSVRFRVFTVVMTLLLLGTVVVLLLRPRM